MCITMLEVGHLAAGFVQAHSTARHVIQAAHDARAHFLGATARCQDAASKGCCVGGKLWRQAGNSVAGSRFPQNTAPASSHERALAHY